MDELLGFIKRQYNNFSIFKAYSISSILKELFLFPLDYLSNSGKSSALLNIALFVTMRCNARCSMCNLSGILNDKEMPDMPFEKIEQLLDDVAGYHPSIILFGGEPFVRKDIVDIVKAVKKRNLTVGMFTNGLLLNEETVNGLIKEELNYVAFSLQGTRDVHDRVLSVKGGYDAMIKSIRLFVNVSPRRTKVITHTTICEYNMDVLENIAEIALDLGVDLIRFGHPTFYSTEESACYNKALKTMLGGGENAKAMSYIYDIRGKEARYFEKIMNVKRKFGDKVSFSPELGEKELRAWYSPEFKSRRRCFFAWRALFIYPNGDAYPCESIFYKMGNVFDNGFSNVWNGARYRAFRQALKNGLLPGCARCCKL